MSPILVRPVREQLEHDRVIRLLQVKLKRRHDVIANIGEDQSTPVKIGQMQIYPDLVLTAADRGRKLMGTVEVETSESVNHLEARAQWAHLGRARAPFHLYVPAGSVDIARRLATENHVNVSEIWSYHTIGDQTRFTLVHRSPAETRRAAEPKPERAEAAADASRQTRRCRRQAATPAASGCASRNRASKEASGRRCQEAAGGVRRGAPRPPASAARPPRPAVCSKSAASEEEVAPAVPAVHPRQARLREHVRRPRGSPARPVAHARPVLVSHAAWREGRAVRARRRGAPPDRSSRTPISSSTGRKILKGGGAPPTEPRPPFEARRPRSGVRPRPQDAPPARDVRGQTPVEAPPAAPEPPAAADWGQTPDRNSPEAPEVRGLTPEALPADGTAAHAKLGAGGCPAAAGALRRRPRADCRARDGTRAPRRN